MDVNTMEVKKSQQITKPAPASTSETVMKAARWRDFLGNIKTEFKKIAWTSPEELRVYTKIVIAATFIFGMGIYFMDLIIQSLLSGLNAMMRFIGG